MRRVWECPVCRRRRRTGGDVVTLLCECQAGADPPRQACMRLVEESRRVPEAGHEPPEQKT